MTILGGYDVTKEELEIWRTVHEYVTRLRKLHRLEMLSEADGGGPVDADIPFEDEVRLTMDYNGIGPEWRDYVEHIIKRTV